MNVTVSSHRHFLALSAALGLLLSFTAPGNPQQNGAAAPEPLTEATEAAANAPVHEAGDRRRDAQSIDEVWVPAGCFTMGTVITSDLNVPPEFTSELASEQPAHQVCLTTGYWIDRYEVTNDAFAAFKAAGGYTKQQYWSSDGWAWLGGKSATSLPDQCIDTPRPNAPQVCVTWYEAEAYANWRGGRLPTEAEWEYAARGPKSPVYPWGDTFNKLKANVLDSTGPVDVGGYPSGASWVDAQDMAGNAMEWVQDWLDPAYYQLKVRDNPTGPTTGTVKVEKGGWWGGTIYAARSAYRHYEDAPSYEDHHIGFRIVTPDVMASPAATPAQ